MNSENIPPCLPIVVLKVIEFKTIVLIRIWYKRIS